MSTKITQLQQLLYHHFGYSNFRPGQLDIISPLTSGQDVLAILPTGGGKSLCFQIPGLFLGGTTLVISPLISLMQDQVQHLVAAGISATYINSTLSQTERDQRLRNFVRGQYQFVYVAPEKLTAAFSNLCRQTPIPLIALDEAHCVSVWGHDFRPAYLQIGTWLRQTWSRGEAKNPAPVIAAFTATASQRVQADIRRYCGLRHPVHIQKSFARPNLHLLVHHCFNEHDKILRLLYLLQKHASQIGIIYVLTRQAAESYAALLTQLLPRFPAFIAYHGGLDKDRRAHIQANFMSGTTPVIIATNAFGMGIDQPHVRFVIHAQISSNLENYFQEVGRGGRDGEPARCYALYTDHDFTISAQFITANHSLSPPRRKILQHQLQQVTKYCRTPHCRQQFILHYLDEKHASRCGHCDNCRHYHFTYPPHIVAHLRTLQTHRARFARAHNLLPSSLITDLSLSYLAVLQPHFPADLTLIPGIGTGFLRQPQLRQLLTTPAAPHVPNPAV